MTNIRKRNYNDFVEITPPTPSAIDLGEIDSGTLTNPPAGSKSLFLDSLDSTVKTKDENGVIESLGSGSGGGLQPLFIDHSNIPSELVRNRIYEADFSAAPATLGKTLVLTGMTNANFDRPYQVANVKGKVNAGNNFGANGKNKVFFAEIVPATTWYCVLSDENDVWSAYSCDTDPNTWIDTQALTLIDEENVVATDEIQDGLFVPDSADAKVAFTGNPANVLTVVFPEGTGAETFIIGFRITGLAEGITVAFETTNSQNIFLPDATTTTTITGVNAKTYFEFAWDQSRYVYGDVDSPTFANLAASLGNVEVDNLTVGTSIIGGEATATQAGTVKNAYLYANGNTNGFTLDGTYQAISFTSVISSGISTSDGLTFTIAHDGKYEIHASAMYSTGSSTASDRVDTVLMIDGVESTADIKYCENTLTFGRIFSAGDFTAGTEIKITARHVSGANPPTMYIGAKSSQYRSLLIKRINP